jgi:DNA-directed RNA polymerase subunit N (RpoN/RPB10)
MANCVTCGEELLPERAEKYDFCTRADCRDRNAKGLEIVAVGVNKAADQPEEIAKKLGVSPYLVTRMLLVATSQGKR